MHRADPPNDYHPREDTEKFSRQRGIDPSREARELQAISFDLGVAVLIRRSGCCLRTRMERWAASAGP